MARLVCQGLQSCLDSTVVVQQAESMTLRLKLASPNHHHHPCSFQSHDHNLLSNPPLSNPHLLLEHSNHHHHHHHHHHMFSNSNLTANMGSWSFLQALSTPHREPTKFEQQDPLRNNTPSPVHYLTTSSRSPRLSQKSLELCTENLGSESGNILDDSENLRELQTREKAVMPAETGLSVSPSSLPSLSPPPAQSCQLLNNGRHENIKKVKPPRNFPPPLTTIAGGSKSIQVRPHRVEGRLIIEAVRAPPRNLSCFQAERSHGRLRLCFFKDPSVTPSLDSGVEKDVDDVVAAARSEDSSENEVIENEVPKEEQEEEEDEEEEQEQEGDDADVDDEAEEVDGIEEEDNRYYWDDEDEEAGNYDVGGGKTAMEMLHHQHHQRSRGPTMSRCKEEGDQHENNRRLMMTMKWEAFWVAT